MVPGREKGRLAALAMAAILCGCVPLYVDEDAKPAAQEEWSRIGSVAVDWTVYRVIGSPSCSLWADKDGARGSFYLPTWPVSWGHACERAWMRYEMAKVSHVIDTARSPTLWWMWPLAAIDSFFHLPPSELKSWRHVFFPDDIPPRMVLRGKVVPKDP